MIDTLTPHPDQVGDRMRGAWLGLLAADFMASKAKPNDVLDTALISMPALEALITIDALGPLRCFKVGAISDALRAMEANHPEADFSHVGDDDGGLLRCLSLSLWLRSKPNWLVVQVLDLCLDISPVEPRGRIATLALCLWARELHGMRQGEDVWQRNLDAWKSVLLDVGYEQADVEAMLGRDATPSEDEETDLAQFMLGYLREPVADWTFEQHILAAIEDTENRRTLVAAAGFMFGLARGDLSIPAEWASSVSRVPQFERTAGVLLNKQRLSPNLRKNLDVTSKNCPIVLSEVACLQGRFLLTTAPGASRNLVYEDRGLIQVRRDMAIDIADLTAAGATHVLTLLRGDELMDADMTSLRMVAEEAGIEWLHLPFVEADLSSPHFRRDLAAVVPILRKALSAGGAIAVHTHDWRGRLPLLLPKLLIAIDSSLGEEHATTLVEEAVVQGERKDDSQRQF